MDRLIDQIQSEIRNKNILGDISYIVLTENSLDELIDDFREEFLVEYMEIGRDPNKSDVQEYLNIPILIEETNDGKKYNLLTKV